MREYIKKILKKYGKKIKDKVEKSKDKRETIIIFYTKLSI